MSDPIALYEWDEAKRAANVAAHKIDFTAVYNFEWDDAVIDIDDREDYGELREIGIGFIGNRLYVVIFTRRADRIRVISLRRAENKDKEKYVADKE
jgi:uncharacterized DUF497 family protein